MTRFSGLALVLLGCSTGDGRPSEGYVPPDDILNAERMDLAAACSGADAGFATAGERIGTAAGLWNRFRGYAIPATEIEGARQCVCNLLGTANPSDVSTNPRAWAAEACCNRGNGTINNWCR